MNAVVFDRTGPPAEVLELREVPAAEPRRGEVLVRMLASPVNPSDLMYVEGKYGLKPTLPATPGFEGVGVVESNGGGVLGWLRKGKRVAVINDRVGNWAEYTVTRARQVIPVPDDLPDEQAATFFVNPATAVAMTRDVLKVPASEWLLQTAAGSNLGQMVIRLGKRAGFRTLNVVRRREQAAELTALGADAVIVEGDGPIEEQVRAAVPGGVRYAIDPVGGATGTAAIASLAPGGRVLLFGSLSDEVVSVHPRRILSGDVRVEGFWLGSWAKSQPVLRMLRLFREVGELIRDGTLTSPIAATYPLAKVREAVTHAAAAGKGGKVLLRIGERN
ncbi:zinc-dependent alcohol dehydrogenase family protein [Urbifossiella limnaea]|uniref:enoyl-[acyl-carrier-protein] reductase n=1 Tax=Urbifossiella limnaea TaxID=2528023 RepID=A0A517XSK6_9BACT|nr:zinc-dependent alcohol dehydrogenase family protein [Urbifossiella limnaea]QDU20462.1 Alcohol dehydrogenase [Urbifossiella limnaea]